MPAKSLVLLTLIMCLFVNGVKADYSWAAHDGSKNNPSYQAACEVTHQFYYSQPNWQKYPHTTYYTDVYGSQVCGGRTTYDNNGLPNHYLCGYLWTDFIRSNGSINTVYHGCLAVNRIGTGCTLPSILNKFTGTCEPPGDHPKNPPGDCPTTGNTSTSTSGSNGSMIGGSSVGNPINFITGNKLLDETDIPAIGDSPLHFSRHYNSLKNYQYQSGFGSIGRSRDPMGLHWSHNYHKGLTVKSSTVQYTRENGQTFTYNLISGAWQADADVVYRLEEITSSGTRTGWKIITPSDTIETYNSAGDLLSITDRKGITQTLTYSVTPTAIAPFKNLLLRVDDSYNRSLSFTYNTVGRIATVTDSAGTIYRYSYDSNYNLTTVTYPDETPSISADNPTKTYVYNESFNTAGVSQIHALTGIIDENHVRYATYQYNAQGKAISTEHANSTNKFSLTYNNDGSTTITDPLGSVRSNFANS